MRSNPLTQSLIVPLCLLLFPSNDAYAQSVVPEDRGIISHMSLVLKDSTTIDYDASALQSSSAIVFSTDNDEIARRFNDNIGDGSVISIEDFVGNLREIEFSITYPDQSEKTVTHDGNWIAQTNALVWDEELMTQDESAFFTESDDWIENPAMIRMFSLSDGTPANHTICKRPGHGGDDQTR